MSGGQFAAVPERFTQALRDGEITFRQYALGTYIIATAHHRTGRLKRTLAVLADECGYPARDDPGDTLGRDLRALEAQGWIHCTVTQGQRSPWLIQTAGLRRSTSAARPQHFRNESPDSAEVTSAWTETWDASNARRETVSEAPRLPHAATPRDIDVDKNPPYPPGGGNGKRRSRTNTERRVSRFERELSDKMLARFNSIGPERQAQCVEHYHGTTGLRETRGMGRGYKRDALGTSPVPSAHSDRGQLPPDFSGRASPEDFLRAWLLSESQSTTPLRDAEAST